VRRRAFLGVLGGAVVAWPARTDAQQEKRPLIGFLIAGTPASHGQWQAACLQRLAELGWVEGRNVDIQVRWAGPRSDSFPDIVADLLKLKVDVIVTAGGAVFEAKRATSSVPIVFAVAADPLGTGLVASLARPGGNITGLSLQQSDVSSKRLELLREVAPGMRRLAVIGNADNSGAAIEMKEVDATARMLGLAVVVVEIRRVEDLASAFERLNGRADALYVCGEALMVSSRMQIATMARAARLPTITDFREYPRAGGLMSYGPSIQDLYRRAADFVDKILRGAKPAEIPVEQPTKFDLVINATTAKALGLSVPPTLLARADEVK
jgi:putative ABC transport system substrate-binding protein